MTGQARRDCTMRLMRPRPASFVAGSPAGAGLVSADVRAERRRWYGWQVAMLWFLAAWLPVSWLMAALSVLVGPLHMHRDDTTRLHGPALWGAQVLVQARAGILDLAQEMSAARMRWTDGLRAAQPHHAGSTGPIAAAAGHHRHGLANGHAHHGVAERHHHRSDDASVILLSSTTDVDLADLLAGLSLSLVGPSTAVPLAGLSPATGGTWPVNQGPCWCSHQPSLPERPPRA